MTVPPTATARLSSQRDIQKADTSICPCLFRSDRRRTA